MRPERLEHVGFTVSDLDRSITFYSELLGWPPFYQATEDRPYVGEILGYTNCRLRIAFFHLPNSGSFLELLEYVDPPGGNVSMETRNVGIGHVCFVVSDLDAEFARLKDLGAHLRSASPIERPDGGRAGYFRDPDGISIELQEAPKQDPATESSTEGSRR